MSELMRFVKRELQIYKQRKSTWLLGLLFYIIVISVFVLGTSSSMLDTAAIWVAVLLSSVLMQSGLFAIDYDTGFIDHLLLTRQPLFLLLLIKIAIYWLVNSIPLIIVTLLFCANLDPLQIQILLLTLLIGTPILCLVGAIGAALTVSLPNSGILLCIILLPLYIPVLLLATGCNYAAAHALPYSGHLALLIAILLGTLLLVPIGVSAALKVNT